MTRAWLAALIVAASAWETPAGAQEIRRPEIVVDLGTGYVLSARDENEAWQPASLVKLMTLYVTLDEISKGRVSFMDPVTISPTAAAQPPSSSGLKVGDRVRLDDALKLLIVRSANDVAWAIGEAVAGTPEAFVAKMNEAARSLDMNSSRFANPHGLFAPDQKTTARDMAVLGATLADIPAAQAIFQIERLALDDKIFSTGNGAMGRIPEVDGMKTGYICASGFNVVTTATAGGRRTLTVVMGYPSSASRDAHSMSLLASALTARGGTRKLSERIYPSDTPTADLTSNICGTDRRLRPGLEAPNKDELAVFNALERTLADPLAIYRYSPPVVAGASVAAEGFNQPNPSRF